MNPEIRNEPRPDILIVSCASVISDEALRATEKYAFCQHAEKAVQKLADSAFKCVVACIDPSAKASFEQLQQVLQKARQGGVPVVTTSQFNPSWIENLMSQFGVTAHFKSFPSRAQLAAVEGLSKLDVPPTSEKMET